MGRASALPIINNIRRLVMTVSTDAILFFGFGLYEEEPEACKGGGISGWTDYYAIKMGIKPPPKEFNDETKPDIKRFWKERDEIVKKSQCGIGAHCSSDYPMYYVYIEVSEITAHRGYPKEVQLNALKVEPSWIILLKTFCETMDIKYQEPKWILCSHWG